MGKTLYIPNPTTTYVDPSLFSDDTGYSCMPVESSKIFPEPNPYEVYDSSVIGIDAPVHVNPTGIQVDMKSVLNQLQNDPLGIANTNVTEDNLKKGAPGGYIEQHKVTDSRDSSTSPSPTPTPTPTPTPGPDVDPSHGTSDDPNDWRYDGNKDNIPDFMQWSYVG